MSDRHGQRRGGGAAGWWAGGTIVTLAVLITAVFRSDAERNALPPTAPPPASLTPVLSPVITLSSAEVEVTPAPSPVPPTLSPDPICAITCLIRLPDPGPTGRASLERRGLRVAYAADGQLCASAPAYLIRELAASDQPPVVADVADTTLPLYVVRIPDGGGAAAEPLVATLGDVVDRAGSMRLVRIAHGPPDVDGLAAAGVWIEKLPPPRSPIPDRSLAPPLTNALALADEVSAEELTRTIADLQSAGATDGELGTRFYAASGNIAAAEYIFRRLSELGLSVWYEDFLAYDGTYATNVVGELPGRDPSRTYLVFAHYDSLADASVAPGADDNASGVAGLLAIARVLAGYQLAHPVRFAALTGEEVDFQGARAFVKRAAEGGMSYAGAFNLDAIGSAVRSHEIYLNGDEASAWLMEVLVRVNDRAGLGEEIVMQQNPEIVADDNIFREAGIPAVLVTRSIYGQSAIHHTAEDVLDNVDLHGVLDCTAVVLIGLGALVEIT